MADHDHVFKVLMVGDSCVGKSSILLQYMRGKTLERDGKTIRLDLWDTAGQERFRALTNSYYKNTNGILLIYSVDDQATFQNVPYWLREVETYCKEDVRTVIIGNKSDLSDNKLVDTDTAKAFAAEKGLLFFETSAKNGTNVKEAFDDLVKQMINVLYPLSLRDTPAFTPTPENNKSSCCEIL